ncbi:MAG: hypothetical protein A2075_17125 [Geobacteraceae bacterium GWC2_58_44]|nr:MAG: hypothetical protein A2075_17125 [Geobacteraceae bacterium GWC2_58_44]HBG04230.1 DUF72 domain-containing protein [Geobacter sp.]
MESGVIRIGTCSWTEKSLIESGTFYPEGITSAEERLRFYARHFDTVELDSSYYAIPTLHMAQAWAERTPEKFLFHVKAYGALTGHSIDPRALPAQLRALLSAEERTQDLLHVSEPAQLRAMAQALIAALAPLIAAHKLGFLIFQFPPWFTCKNANRDYLLYCKELMAGLPIAVEFRHGSWLTRQHADELFAFLREHKITYITCDEPQYGNLTTAPFHPEITTSVAYLRLHGRNAESWLQHATARNDYLYGEQELTTFASVARRLSSKARITFLMFNNCHGGQAVRNALQMQKIT